MAKVQPKTVIAVKKELEQQLGQFVMQVGTLQEELQKKQKQVNDIATALEKLNGK